MSKVRFNMEHRSDVWKAHRIEKKDGFFTVTDHPNGLYCFPLRKELGINGELDEHPLLGTKWHKKSKPDTHYVIDSVCVHWLKGYYYHVTLRDENNSHATAMVENINTEEEIVLDAIKSFKENWSRSI